MHSIVVFGTYTHLTLAILLMQLQLELREWIRLGPDRVVFAVALVAVMVILPYVLLTVYALLGVVSLGSTTYQMF